MSDDYGAFDSAFDDAFDIGTDASASPDGSFSMAADPTGNTPEGQNNANTGDVAFTAKEQNEFFRLDQNGNRIPAAQDSGPRTLAVYLAS